ncbi:hypothetical protein [Planococcus lenghuensis]|uniref:SurA-like protein n=1 Tax=Planococcus lenghuensis TaxID=2213202 RepID=A0A1Q2KWU1_9BACL|nr:hypothetical protein [Planococcus lenghuensis]AQQ52596.1 hypothetical protein B0X71_05460 [Planococcus lenghuensis]
MGKNILLIALLGMLLAGCEETGETEAAVEVEMKSMEEQQKQLETFTYEDYRMVFDEAAARAEELATEDDLLNKWILRVLADDELLYASDFSDEEAIRFARQEMVENEAWKRYAQEEYGVSITETEVDEFITKGPIASLDPDSDLAYDESYMAMQKAIADSLGLTQEELEYEFQRDLYERAVIWEKLEPELTEKYGESADVRAEYNEEVNAYMNS